MTVSVSESQPWWQLDLGQIESVQTITLWNRTDAYPERLSNFYLIVSDDPFTSTSLSTTLAQPGVSSYYTSGQAGVSTPFLINRTARYVRVQLSGANILSLAEVQVNTAQYPYDQERDGIADYLEDANGDGLVSSGESDHKGPIVTITVPTDGFAVNTTRINVQGSFSHTSPLNEILVNGVRAFFTGTTFECLNVPLSVGANVIFAAAVDRVGNAGTAQINISGVPIGANLDDPVILSASPTGGFDPLTVTFTPTVNAPGTVQEVRYDFTGNNNTELGTLGPTSHPYAAGQYFPVITIQTTSGKFSSKGGWNDTDIHRLRINVQVSPVAQSQNVISITDPVDVKTTAAGHLYVLSRASRSITQYDANAAVVRSLTGIGSASSAPRGLDVDSAGKVYVALSADNQIAKFKPIAGSFQLDTMFGASGLIGKADRTSGSGNGEFNAPFDVTVTPDGEEIAVTDSNNHRIQRFTKGGVFRTSLGEQGSGDGQFNTPRGIACDEVGYFYIVDSLNNRVVLMTLSEFSGTSGSSGMALGQLQGALNLGVGSRGIYVADTGNNRVQCFDPLTHAHGASLSPFKPRYAVSSLSSLSPTGLSQPNAVAPAADLLEEKIYVADTANNRVILIKVPGDNPKPAWDSMKARLVVNDIEGAIPYFSELSANKYRQVFLSIGTTDLNTAMSQVPAIVPVFIENETAQYVFDQVIQGFTISFPIEFIKENGVWKITEY